MSILHVYHMFRDRSVITTTVESLPEVNINLPYYGHSFAFGQDGAIYMTGSSSPDTGNNIAVSHLCMPNEIYTGTTCMTFDTREDETSGWFSVNTGIQNTSDTTSWSLDHAVPHQRLLSQTVFDFGCSAGEFGVL